MYEDDHIYSTSAINLDFTKPNLFVTFEGWISRTPFVKQLQTILKTLQEKMNTPVDIEFAHDGVSLYLLQCRPQSSTAGNVASPIPKDIAEERIVFSANRYISNGKLPDITHIVYVDPENTASSNGSEETARGGTGGRQAEQASPQATVHSDGAGALGQPRRHQARRQRSPIPTSTIRRR